MNLENLKGSECKTRNDCLVFADVLGACVLKDARTLQAIVPDSPADTNRTLSLDQIRAAKNQDGEYPRLAANAFPELCGDCPRLDFAQAGQE